MELSYSIFATSPIYIEEGLEVVIRKPAIMEAVRSSSSSSSHRGSKESMKQLRQFVYSLSNSISDSDMENCNRLFMLKSAESEAQMIYTIGKGLEVSFRGKEEEMAASLLNLERKDARKNGPWSRIVNRGNKSGSQ